MWERMASGAKKVMSNQFKQYFNNIEQARNLRNCNLFVQMKDMQLFQYVKLMKFEALKLTLGIIYNI